MKKQVDIAIVGGAMAGACLALSLARLQGPNQRRYQVALIEAKAVDDHAHPGYDSRAIALADGSVSTLQQLGLWSHLAPQAAAIERIEVSDRGHFGGVAMTAAEYGVASLGQVVELERTGAALWQQLQQADVTLYCPNSLADLRQHADFTELTLNDGSQLQAKLVVGADGTMSQVRQQLHIGLERQPYQQTAVIANISCSEHGVTAYERFTADGPLALLPMSDGRYSLVWVQSDEQAQQRLQLSEHEFRRQLQQAFGQRLGRIDKIGARASYPLALCQAERIHHHRCVLIGNAAQTVHPIAGQGFNLGLRDVAALVQQLQQALEQQQDPGEFSRLLAYADSREADRQRVTGLTDGLVKLFSTSSRVMALGRNCGLLSMALIPTWKRKLAYQAMGWRSSAN
ncbi:2-octaprenyl-6-methoxyphenyl hydroxylase [uncultured Ferrimonas sp.]|uniref:2-octaprenyl-6-methoxyphenyl hydroxylase n=1 Tax=uncultured Ferrimonas sp. TaxID=432640 RepID=UPI002606C282|nr:2-octaprenyl-6-methoxyphenyl hydroxylase [uncultured Ferrimonas sp.]